MAFSCCCGLPADLRATTRYRWPALARLIDVLAVVLFLVAAASFAFGVSALEKLEDFRAIYLIVVGGLSLRASTELLRPRGGSA